MRAAPPLLFSLFTCTLVRSTFACSALLRSSCPLHPCSHVLSIPPLFTEGHNARRHLNGPCDLGHSVLDSWIMRSCKPQIRHLKQEYSTTAETGLLQQTLSLSRTRLTRTTSTKSTATLSRVTKTSAAPTSTSTGTWWQPKVGTSFLWSLDEAIPNNPQSNTGLKLSG